MELLHVPWIGQWLDDIGRLITTGEAVELGLWSNSPTIDNGPPGADRETALEVGSVVGYCAACVAALGVGQIKLVAWMTPLPPTSGSQQRRS
jgi:hypothetical protein